MHPDLCCSGAQAQASRMLNKLATKVFPQNTSFFSPPVEIGFHSVALAGLNLDM